MRLFLTHSTIELWSRDSGFRLGAGMDNDFALDTSLRVHPVSLGRAKPQARNAESGSGVHMSPRGDPRQEPIKNPFPGLKKQLEEEYPGLPESKIDEVARQALGEFDGARVREFVPILAWRRARKQLRKPS